MTPLEMLASLGIATLGGAVVGLEREWSGHAAGPAARFAGIRTFGLVGLAGGLAGCLTAAGAPGLAIALAAGTAALIAAAYVMASRHDVDGTTEVAALVVLGAGTLAGLGQLAVAGGVAVATGLVLVEKSRLHAFAARIDATELRAGIRFAAMALVVLPMLPAGPFGPAPGIRPRELWGLVLFFSGLGFVGHIARRAVGPKRAQWMAGALGGLISSTNVTVTFARTSRSEPQAGCALAVGALAANLMLFPRVLLASAILHPPLAAALAPWLLAPAAILAAAALWEVRHGPRNAVETPTVENPLRVGAALQMAVLFQVVLYAAAQAQEWFGQAGLHGAAAVLGLTDVDALTMTMSRVFAPTAGADVAARGLVVGILSNTLLKSAAAVAIGAGRYRVVCGAALAAAAAAFAVELAL
ncbi:MAG: MgtC/SapB family protein [Vicinamibacterales bacterium]